MATSKIDVWNMALQKIGHTKAIASENDRTAEANVCRAHYDTLLRLVLETGHWPWALRQRTLSEISDQSETTLYAAVVDAAKLRIPLNLNYLDSTQVAVVRISAAAVETELVGDTNYSLTVADEEDGTENEVVLSVALAVGESIRVTLTTTRVGWEFLYGLPADLVTPVGLLREDLRFTMLPVKGRIPFEIMLNDAGDGHILACDFDTDSFDKLEYVALVTYVPAMSAHFVDALACRLAAELALAIRKDEALALRRMQMYAAALDRASAYAQNVGEPGPPPLSPSIAARGGG